MRPVDSKYPVTLGYRQKMRSRPSYIHRGVDYGAPVGSTVRASKGGRVVHAGRGGMGSAFGIHVVVKTSDGIYVIVAHLSSESASVGQQVKTGDILGKSGATGNVTGPHVHYGELTSYSYLADRKPQYLDDAPTPPKPTPKPTHKLVRHFEHRHLNTWGDDGGKGTASFYSRVDKMAADLVSGTNPEVITLNEVQDDDVASWKKRLKANSYDVVLAEHGNLVALPGGTEVRKSQSKLLPDAIQGKGRKEALGMVRAKINGHWEHIFVSHLDYRDGYNALRVKQAAWIADEAERWAGVFDLDNWRTHTTIGIDENSNTWVRDKAMIPAGLKVAVKSGIDAIYGNRAALSADVIKTSSDHPIITVVYGKSVPV